MKAKFLFKILITTLIFSLILFISAGKANYFQGWIFLTINILSAFMNYWTIRNEPELMNERSKVGDGSKSWDKKILAFSSLVYLFNIVIAGLDSGRFQWSPDFHWSIYVLGIGLTITGQVVFLIARNENKFFSSVVRIQSDRGHTVCNTGIYKFIRHPGYLGMIISFIGFPFITGSVWSTTTTVAAIILLILRTHFEDETLKSELTGYIDYTKNTKYRLIPKIW